MFPSSCSLQLLCSASPQQPSPLPLSRCCHLYYSADKIKVPNMRSLVSISHFKISQKLYPPPLSFIDSPCLVLHHLGMPLPTVSSLLHFQGPQPLESPELGLQQKALLCQSFMLMSRFRPFLSCLEPLMCSSHGWKETPPLKSAHLHLLLLPNPWHR